MLADLADDFPLLASLVEQRAGQRRLPVTGPGPVMETAAPVAVHEPPAAVIAEGAAPGAEPWEVPASSPPVGARSASEPSSPPPATGHVASGPRARRSGRYGLSIQFEARPGDPELGRLVESTVWVNEAHPAYRPAVASRSEGYHVALAVAMALAPLAVDPAKEHAFITAFLGHWGAAIERRKRRRRP